MDHKAIRGISFFISLSECGHNQIRIRISRDMPGNDFSGVQIHHNAQIVPFPSRFDVGNIAGPYEIGGFLVKVLLQMVSAGPILGRSGRERRFSSGHFREL